MAKDYAKRVFTTSTRKPKKKRLRIEMFFIVLVFIILGVGYVMYQHSKPESGTFFSRIKSVLKHEPLIASKLPKAKLVKNEAETGIHFDFYNELPNMQVTIPETGGSEPTKVVQKSIPTPIQKVAISKATTPAEHVTAAQPTKAADLASQYILQLGVFKDQAGASQMRLSLLLSGCEAEVYKVSSDEGYIYRLQNGPFDKMADAKILQQKLQRKGISSVVKKVG